MGAMMGSVYIAGRLATDPVFSETSKGNAMCKILLETELIREMTRGEFRAETHLLPITLLLWVADQARALKNGDSVTIGCRLNGSRFKTPSGEVRHGVQLVAESLFPSSPVATIKEAR